MEKVYVVMYEDCYTYGEWDTTVKVFQTKEKAVEFADECFKDFLESEGLKYEDLKEDYNDADDEEWVVEKNGYDITCWRNGFYVEDHFKISIEESEVL